MKIFFVVLLIITTISVVAVVVYVASIVLWGNEMHFGYVRLLFALSVIGGGLFSSYFIHISGGSFIYSATYGVITSLSIFFLIGFFIVNIYGS